MVKPGQQTNPGKKTSGLRGGMMTRKREHGEVRCCVRVVKPRGSRITHDARSSPALPRWKRPSSPLLALPRPWSVPDGCILPACSQPVAHPLRRQREKAHRGRQQRQRRRPCFWHPRDLNDLNPGRRSTPRPPVGQVRSFFIVIVTNSVRSCDKPTAETGACCVRRLLWFDIVGWGKRLCAGHTRTYMHT